MEKSNNNNSRYSPAHNNLLRQFRACSPPNKAPHLPCYRHCIPEKHSLKRICIFSVGLRAQRKCAHRPDAANAAPAVGPWTVRVFGKPQVRRAGMGPTGEVRHAKGTFDVLWTTWLWCIIGDHQDCSKTACITTTVSTNSYTGKSLTE